MTTREKIFAAWLLLLTAGFGVLLAKTRHASFDELSVQRLNVVEPDGKLRLVIANAPRFPEIFMDGREYPHPGRERGGMLFFNEQGDEVGGLSFSGQRTADGHQAGALLAFDQFRQDQIVAIQYQDDNGKRMAGLRVWDRPEWDIKQLIEINAAAAGKPEAQVKAAREQMMAFATAHGLPAERAFVGKTADGSSVLKLSDKQGRPRLVLAVDEAGTPKLKFLDENGKVVTQIPALVR